MRVLLFSEWVNPLTTTAADTLIPEREPLLATIRREGLTRCEYAAVLGRLGYCLWSSTALLFISARLGVSAAGYAVAVFTICAAVSAVPLCAVFEARAKPVLISGMLTLNCCAGVLLEVADRAHPEIALCAAALAGVSAPPTAAVMRSLWQGKSASVRISRMLGMESLITQICLVISPVIVGFLVASPLIALAPIAATGCVCIGNGLMWSWSRPHVPQSAPPVSSSDSYARTSGAARLTGIFTLICASAMVSGFFNISVASRFAGRPELPDGPGLVIAAAAAGSIAGGVIFTRLWKESASRWGYPVLLAGWMLALWLVASASQGYLVLALAFASGLPVTGIGAEEYRLLGASAGNRSARLFGLANTAIRSGVGLGAAFGAQIIRHFGNAAPILPAAAATAALVLTAALWPSLGVGARKAAKA